jgi:outer membrane receptor protein involved in Fe transport
MRTPLTTAMLAMLAASAGVAQAPPQQAAEEFRFYEMALVTARADDPPADALDLETVTAEQIEARNARTVAEALASVPGIRVSTGRKNEPNVSIHGFDQSRILVLIDGVPYYETAYGRLDLNQISTDNVARIEVRKGAASVLYGANALGGVINIVTKRAADAPYLGGTVEAGPDGLLGYRISNGMMLGQFSYWVSYSHVESDSWETSGDFEPTQGRIVTRSPSSVTPAVLQPDGARANSDVDRDDAWLKLGWESGRGSAYWVNIHYLDMTKGLPPATDQVTVNLARPAFSQLARMPGYRDTGVDLDISQPLSPRLALKAKLFYHEHRDNYDSYRDQTYTEKLARSTFEDALSGASAVLESPVGARNTARLALNYKRDTHAERDDVYLPFAETRSDTGSVGLEDEFALGETLRLVAGASYDWFDVGAAERNVLAGNGDLIGQAPLPTSSEGFFNPMAGVTWSLGAGEAYASLGRKSRSPLLTQLYSSRNGNPDLRPERSTNFVAGYRSPAGRSFGFDASAFWYDVSDLISRSGVDPSSAYQNYAKVRIRGIELGANLVPLPGLTLRADLTFNDASDVSPGRVTEHVVNVPELMAGFAITWQPAGIPGRLDLDGTYMDSVYASLPSPKFPNDPVRLVDSYFLTNLRAGVDVLPRLELWLAVRNVFDVDYESEYAFPGPGRSVSFGMSGRL